MRSSLSGLHERLQAAHEEVAPLGVAVAEEVALSRPVFVFEGELRAAFVGRDVEAEV